MEKENLEQKIGSGYNIVFVTWPQPTGRRRWTPPGLIICAGRPLPSRKKSGRRVRLYARSFQGEDFETFKNAVAGSFETHKIFKPQSCRKESKEIYIIGLAKI
ncbi:MAG: SAM-dependent methyltransferase [Desulfobacterales bacterium]